MKFLKLVFFGCILLIVFKHHSQILGVVPFVPKSPKQIQANIQDLEEQIEFQKGKRSVYNDIIGRIPAPGTVVGHLPCGAKIIAGNADTSGLHAEASRAQAEVERLEQKLRVAKEQLAHSQSSQP